MTNDTTGIMTIAVPSFPITFTDTDTDSNIDDITGITPDSAGTITGLAQGDLSFTADTITINIDSTSFPSGGSASFTITFAAPQQPTEAPEPASLALLGVGLTGLGAAVRRRRRA